MKKIFCRSCESDWLLLVQSSLGEIKSSTKSEQRKWLQTGWDLRPSDAEALPSWLGRFPVLVWIQLGYTMLLSLIRRPRFRSFDQRLDLENRRAEDAVGQATLCEPYYSSSSLRLQTRATTMFSLAPTAGVHGTGYTECSARLTWMAFASVSHEDLVVKPQMGHSHPVLGQSPSLVWTNDGGGAQRLHSL